MSNSNDASNPKPPRRVEYYCCHMLGDLQCINPAEFWVGSNGVDKYTYACSEHVKELMQDGDAVFPIEESL